jgi:uncharacterized membrane protein (UPF0127 family)
MRNMKYKFVGILAILFIIVLFGSIGAKKGAPDETPALTDAPVVSGDEDPTTYDEAIVKIGKETFSVLVADTQKKRALGLSGMEERAPRHGMLFVFDKPGNYPFWMKDMNFAIDILWINEHNEIIHILEYIAPETYPTAFTSSEDALYVLELPMGTVAKTDIRLGDKIVYDQ